MYSSAVMTSWTYTTRNFRHDRLPCDGGNYRSWNRRSISPDCQNAYLCGKEIICLKRFLYRKKQNRIVISRKIFYKTLTFGKWTGYCQTTNMSCVCTHDSEPEMVPAAGLEPATPWLQIMCSTWWAKPARKRNIVSYFTNFNAGFFALFSGSFDTGFLVGSDVSNGIISSGPSSWG